MFKIKPKVLIKRGLPVCGITQLKKNGFPSNQKIKKSCRVITSMGMVKNVSSNQWLKFRIKDTSPCSFSQSLIILIRRLQSLQCCFRLGTKCALGSSNDIFFLPHKGIIEFLDIEKMEEEKKSWRLRWLDDCLQNIVFFPLAFFGSSVLY